MADFAGAFVTGEWWMVLVGVPFALFGFSLVAPTRGQLARRQQQLYAQGSTLGLVEVLVSSPFKMERGAK